MKIYKILIIVFVISLLVLQKCTFFNSGGEIKNIRQELLYDSLFKNKKRFDVSLYTTLDFGTNIVSKNDCLNFLLIINTDTFPLIPEFENIEIMVENKVSKVKFTSQINFTSVKYDNDSLSKIILKDSKVIDKDGKEILRNKSYTLKSLIKFHKIQNDGIKYE